MQTETSIMPVDKMKGSKFVPDIHKSQHSQHKAPASVLPAQHDLNQRQDNGSPVSTRFYDQGHSLNNIALSNSAASSILDPKMSRVANMTGDESVL